MTESAKSSATSPAPRACERMERDDDQPHAGGAKRARMGTTPPLADSDMTWFELQLRYNDDRIMALEKLVHDLTEELARPCRSTWKPPATRGTKRLRVQQE